MSLLKSPWLHALHEGHEGGLQYYGTKPSWIVFTEEVGRDPSNRSGKNFSQWTNAGYWPVVRINHGYGSTGTIPLPQYYSDFGTRVGNYVEASSQGVYYWIIGNEPNLAGEWPDGKPISPEQYVSCFKMCRNAIKMRSGHRGDVVIPAPIAPYNVDSGDWLGYNRKVWTLLEGDCDGLACHTYTHGADPALITSEAKMNPPYQNRYYNFRAYRDFMGIVPFSMRSLPMLITESDQNDPWADKPSDWIRQAYNEINYWNSIPINQTIQCLAMYRFPNYDKWYMVGKNEVLGDFKSAVLQGFQSPEPRNFMDKNPVPPEAPKPVEPPQKPLTTGVVIANTLNVRKGPGTTFDSVGTKSMGDTVSIYETVNSFYRIGMDQWVSTAWVTTKEDEHLQSGTNWDRCLAFVLKWEGGWADNPLDPGGATMKGITYGTYIRWLRDTGRMKHDEGGMEILPTKDELHAIKDAVVSEIYYKYYWVPSKAIEMYWPMCLAQMDLAVNGGVGRAEEALKANGMDFWNYMVWRKNWYESLDDFKFFGDAWINRCKDLLLTAYE